MSDKCTFDSFRKDTADHSMEIIKDDGLHRHLKFSRNGSQVYRFDLITWPGHLCICGDMHTYVFSRIPDMFGFFNVSPPSNINPGYWGEKLDAEHYASRYGKEWSVDAFTKSVQKYLNNNLYDTDDDIATQIRAEVNDSLQHISDEYEAVDFIRTFESDDFTFSDFWEYSTEEYSYHYLWCCYAIAWGIQQYNTHNSKEAAQC